MYPVPTFGVFDLLLGEAQSLLVTVRKFLFPEKALDVAHKRDNRRRRRQSTPSGLNVWDIL